MAARVIPFSARPAPVRRVPAPPPDAARLALAAIVAQAAEAAQEAAGRGEKLAAADLIGLAVTARNALVAMNGGGGDAT
ncbi:hypothetical protein [Rhodocista pekingensis]|uniref:Uncharacterized protein n=1 Tax=Rhodocista pekingensis TaxID=201185 RepID=A0ABW2KUC9_9PROT